MQDTKSETEAECDRCGQFMPRCAGDDPNHLYRCVACWTTVNEPLPLCNCWGFADCDPLDKEQICRLKNNDGY